MKNKRNANRVIKVGIVDDQLSVATGYALLLNSMKDIRVVLQASDGRHLLNSLKTMEELPDILLMDVYVKVMNGITAIRKIAKLYPRIKVIALGGKDEQYNIIRNMIDAGACAYLSKEIPIGKMELAIREVYSKGKYEADLYHLYTAGLSQFDREVKELSFSEKEKGFLRLLCKGYSYTQISEALKVSEKSAQYYFSCISRKLNTKSYVIMAFEALRLGIINPLDETETGIK